MEEERQTTTVRETQNADGTAAVRQESSVSESRTSGANIARRVVWYITGVIVTLLALRVVLQLLGANDTAGFVTFIYSLSGIFAAPFYGIFNYQPVYGQSYLEVSTLVAIIVYLLVGWGIAKLFTLTQR